MKRYCAIDFDGVVLRNHSVHAHVAGRCAAYVGRKLRLDAERAAARNKELYETHGHTLLGLQKAGVSASLKDFNEFVYSDIDYAHELEGLASTHARDIDGLDALLQACEERMMEPFVFSNAPAFYVDAILQHMARHARDSSRINRLTSVDTVTKDLLKPDPGAYAAVNRALGPASFLFLDDRLQNILPTLVRANWTGVLVTERVPMSSTMVHTTPSLLALARNMDRVVL